MMDPKTNRPTRFSLGVKRQAGQLTVFFATSFVLLITIMAFIINIGMYVKAKINLQNAADAAAFAGASVQARLLTNIAHINWEMRNVYKEWMFKYYVLGQSGLKPVRNVIYQGSSPDSDPGPTQTSAQSMSFQMAPFGATLATSSTSGKIDPWNIPSVCIHFDGTYNICNTYKIPGLPRFQNVGMGGMDDTLNAVLTTISEEKAADCTNRGKYNYQVAAHWAYGIPGSSSAVRAPQIVEQRPGAWPAAIELAFRIRSLESMVNAPPLTGGICLQGCSNPIDNISANEDPFFERSVKAYYSAFRNLGGPGNGDGANHMKSNLIVTELAPREIAAGPDKDLSFVFLPSNIRRKFYLDLQPLLMNYVTFYTSFTSKKERDPVTGVLNEGECEGTKVGIPVPAYPMGFVKRAGVMTYYAVKLETKFIGLFNPFNLGGGQGTTITAYAAAKPFGGRIGPHLFAIAKDRTAIRVRQQNSVYKSFPYATALDLSNKPDPTSYTIGDPIPEVPEFWADQNGSEAVGGSTSTGTFPTYVIPNLLYDLQGDMDGHKSAAEALQVVKYDQGPPSLRGGLFDPTQFFQFASNINRGSGLTSMDPNTINQAIDRVKAPTVYEALNYLIPDYDPGQAKQTAFVSQVSEVDGKPQLKVYAPLYCPRCPYQSLGDIEDYLNRFYVEDIAANSIEAFAQSMKNVADKIRNSASQNVSGIAVQQAEFEGAALGVSDATDATGLQGLSCDSISGAFINFYKGLAASTVVQKSRPCEPDSLVTRVKQYWESELQDDKVDFHKSLFSYRDFGPPYDSLGNDTDGHFLTAYRPGQLYGMQSDTVLPHPYGISSFRVNPRRNYYSTKFVALRDLTPSGAYFQKLSESHVAENKLSAQDEIDNRFRNVNNALEAPIQSGNITF